MVTNKPYAPSADNNKDPILRILSRYLAANDRILEIGSGTGQHVCYFAEKLPKMLFQPSDLPKHLEGILHWIEESLAENILPPIVINVSDRSTYPSQHFNAVYSANTTHIMSIDEVNHFFRLVNFTLGKSGVFILYGPFNENGDYTSESNRQFDQHLKSRAAHMGIRDIVDLKKFANDNGLCFKTSHAMPNNNQILIFKKLC